MFFYKSRTMFLFAVDLISEEIPLCVDAIALDDYLYFNLEFLAERESFEFRSFALNLN